MRRFRHARERNAKAVESVAIRASAVTPVELETLAGHLENQLAALEAQVPVKYKRKENTIGSLNFSFGREKEEDVKWRLFTKITTLKQPLGKRSPRISRHMGHLTVSWKGTAGYHSRAWFRGYGGSSPVEYEVKVFFKGTVDAPTDWHTVHSDFSNSGGASAQEAWNNITTNSFVVICRNSAEPETRLGTKVERVAAESGLVKSHHPALEASLKNPERWKWFAFPGVDGAQKIAHVTCPPGQMTYMIPGDFAHKAVGKKVLVPSGTCLFINPHSCALAIETKVFPNAGEIARRDILCWIWTNFKRLLVVLAILGVVAGTSYSAYLTYKLVEPYLTPIVRIFKGEVIAVEPKVIKGKDDKIEAQRIELEAKTLENKSQASEIDELHKLPRGLDKPPCWPNGEGHLDFLMEIYISDAGLKIKHAPRKTPLRAERQRELEDLPFDKDLFGRTITAEEFRREFKSTYEATMAAQCRHFVIIDEGQHSEVDRYKHDRDIIESYFYIKRRQFGQY